MPFKAPDVADLVNFTDQALRDLFNSATAARDELIASGGPDGSPVTQENVTDEQVDNLESLKTFRAAVTAELTRRGERMARFSAASAKDADKSDEDKDADKGPDKTQ